MSDLYILKDKIPIKVGVLEWAQNFERIENRRVAETILDLDDDVRVSTVFLGIDHSWAGPPPIVFETMIFGGKHDQYQDRYSTWKQAEEGHERAVKIAKGEMDTGIQVNE